MKCAKCGHERMTWARLQSMIDTDGTVTFHVVVPRVDYLPLADDYYGANVPPLRASTRTGVPFLVWPYDGEEILIAETTV
jgi:hypothetical protein